MQIKIIINLNFTIVSKSETCHYIYYQIACRKALSLSLSVRVAPLFAYISLENYIQFSGFFVFMDFILPRSRSTIGKFITILETKKKNMKIANLWFELTGRWWTVSLFQITHRELISFHSKSSLNWAKLKFFENECRSISVNYVIFSKEV